MMRKAWWLAAGLVALWGCSGEEGGGGADNPPPAPPAVQEGPPGGPGPGAVPPPGPEAGAPKEEPKAEPPKADEPKGEAPKAEAPKGEASADDALSAEEIAEIKKLPAADQAQALAQKLCPVSDEHLGGDMGPPVKVTRDGKTFFLCCKGCEKELDKNLATYLAKVAPKK